MALLDMWSHPHGESQVESPETVPHPSSKVFNQKQYHIPKRIFKKPPLSRREGASSEGAGVVVPTISPFSSPICPLQEAAQFWKRTVDYHKFNKVVAIITAAGSDVVSLLGDTEPAYGKQPHLW